MPTNRYDAFMRARLMWRLFATELSARHFDEWHPRNDAYWHAVECVQAYLSPVWGDASQGRARSIVEGWHQW